MLKKVFIARNYRSKFDAAGKAKMDCETILLNNGWKNIGFKQTWISNSVVGTLISALGVTWALIRLKTRSYLCLQYPFNKFYQYCLWAAKIKKCTVLTIVHDVKSLKGKYEFSQEEINILGKSEQLIVHNASMRKWFEQQGVKSQLFEISAFDYLHSAKNKTEQKPTNFQKLRIVFAGNMGSKRSFIYDFDTLNTKQFKVDLYGVGFHSGSVKKQQNSSLDYKGVFPADQVIDRIDGDFGLVWYGDSIDSCDGSTGQYLKYNNPHKLSLYILCGMPIIIWDKAAIADFVTRNKIGLTVSSLRELPDKLKALRPSDIETLKNNVSNIKNKMQNGEFLGSALVDAESNL